MKLKKFNIIRVIKQKRGKRGTFLSNTYVLLDKTEWLSVGICERKNRKQEVPLVNGSDGKKQEQPQARDDINRMHEVPDKGTHNKGTHNKGTVEIFNYWNKQKIIRHKVLSSDIEEVVVETLRNSSSVEIMTAIERYANMLSDETYDLCSYKWSLVEFLSHKKGYKEFLVDGSKWINYRDSIGRQSAQNKNPYEGVQ